MDMTENMKVGCVMRTPDGVRKIERVVRVSELGQYIHLVTRAGWSVVSAEWTDEGVTE